MCGKYTVGEKARLTWSVGAAMRAGTCGERRVKEGRKKNTQSMEVAQDQTRAKQYLQITFQASWSVQQVVFALSGQFKWCSLDC